jgi:hypothetical protein
MIKNFINILGSCFTSGETSPNAVTLDSVFNSNALVSNQAKGEKEELSGVDILKLLIEGPTSPLGAKLHS